jgi:hypothetical protein
LITTKTAFVLGAGASKPYGLPLGLELYNNVIQHFGRNISGGGRKQDLLDAGYPPAAIDAFVDALRLSGLTSLDAFLEKRTAFMDVGKAILAIEILRAENGGLLWATGVDNWMQYLFSKMVTKTVEQFSENTMSFITYNYDRTLEQFLFHSLNNLYGKDPDLSAKAVSEIPIVHLHGRLGYLHWQRSKGVEIPFQVSQPIHPQILEECRRQIRIVHEDIQDRDEEFKLAHRILTDADRIYFLGFGYGAENCRRLEFDELDVGRAEGTAIGLTVRERETASGLLDGKVTLIQDMNCFGVSAEQSGLGLSRWVGSRFALRSKTWRCK